MLYLAILGIIAIGAALLFIYYSVKDKKPIKPKKDVKPNIKNNDDVDDKGKVIYLFDDDKDSDNDVKDEVGDDEKSDNKEDKTVDEENPDKNNNNEE